jgi:hypothetical protein
MCRASTRFGSRALDRRRGRRVGSAVLVFGLMPALVAARDNLAPLRLDTRSGRETRRRRIARQTLVASQVALAVIAWRFDVAREKWNASKATIRATQAIIWLFWT